MICVFLISKVQVDASDNMKNSGSSLESISTAEQSDGESGSGEEFPASEHHTSQTTVPSEDEALTECRAGDSTEGTVQELSTNTCEDMPLATERSGDTARESGSVDVILAPVVSIASHISTGKLDLKWFEKSSDDNQCCADTMEPIFIDLQTHPL